MSAYFIAICAECNRIISQTPAARQMISHGICQKCAEHLYPELSIRGGGPVLPLLSPSRGAA